MSIPESESDLKSLFSSLSLDSVVTLVFPVKTGVWSVCEIVFSVEYFDRCRP